MRLWFGRSGHAREEHDDEYGTTVSVRKGDLWWQLDADGYATTNADDPEVPNGVAEEYHSLLEPAGLLAGLVFESLGDGQVAGRATVRARAVPRETRHPEQLALLYQVGGGDEYRLDIDAERGTLLRVEARIDGVPFLIHEVTGVVFDEPFEPERFELAAPAGERFRAVTEEQPTMTGLTLEQVTELAPFTVWAPAELPPGWHPKVTFVAASERWDLAPTVFLRYSASDASHWFPIQQWQAGSGTEHAARAPAARHAFLILARATATAAAAGALDAGYGQIGRSGPACSSGRELSTHGILGGQRRSVAPLRDAVSEAAAEAVAPRAPRRLPADRALGVLVA